ncbi:MAG: cbb3-type cytochrome c oxidase subunit I [Candidatus Thermoplasmatota archaeon]|nr:cbb3-type cytochrome c oxidase subunit I [Candidatus Thermoplasmatota archaeon]
MSTLTLLITAGVVTSLAAILVFLLYYLAASKNEAAEITARDEGYPERGAYVREQMYGKPRALSWSIFIYDDAKSIGLRYIFTSLLFLFLAGAFGVLMRVSLTDPNPTIINPIIYNIFLTQHAVLMIYMFAIGSAFGSAYYLLPTYLKLKRDNMGHFSSVAYWLWFLGGSLFLVSKSSARWYLYPPLSLQLQPFGGGTYDWLAIIAMEMIFIGITLASIVVLKIIFIDRSDDIPLAEMPVFAWSVVFTLIMLISADPPLMIGLGMLFYDLFNPIFFTGSPSNPLTFAILFWFWGHPIVYIAILPFFGLMYDIISRFTETPVYSYFSAVFSLGLLMILSEVVWGHHLLNSGLGIDWVLFFTTTSFLVVIPSALTVFNMIGTMWNAKKIRLTTPMLFVINGIFDFILGGVSGVMLANQSVNEIAHGTYFVTGHFHFVFVGVTLGVTAAVFYLLFPTFSNGRVYNERLAKWHLYITAVGSFLMSMSWEVGGFIGMPRAVAGYFAQFQVYQDSAILGGVIIGIGQFVFLYNITKSWSREPATDPYNILEYRTETNQIIGGGK